MAHRLSRADVEPAVPLLRQGRGWAAAVQAVNAGRAVPASQRTIRRVMARHGLLEAWPRAPPPAGASLGGRPRKPDLSDADFEFATRTLATAATPNAGYTAVADKISQDRLAAHRAAGGAVDLDLGKRLRVSSRWVERAMRARGWTPAPRCLEQEMAA